MTNDITQDLCPPSAEPSAARVNWSQLGWGIAVLSAGLLLILDRLYIVDVGDFWRHSPWILVAFGLVALARGKSSKRRDGGWWLLGAGLYLLINLWEVWNFWWGNSWPLILIFIGLANFIDPAKPKERADSFWLLGIGGFFLLAQGLFFGLDFEDAWPVLLIVAGLVLTLRALFGTGKSSKGGES